MNEPTAADGGQAAQQIPEERRSLGEAAQDHVDPVLADDNDVPDPEELQTREG
ncbi:MAG TPA: hypothetical protein VHJ78_09975 [Actinomycetota bacterium]|nr:hypothetical protein [Actinomycetota bacterium]